MCMGTGRILQKNMVNDTNLLGNYIIFTIRSPYTCIAGLCVLYVYGCTSYLRKSHTEFSENNMHNVIHVCYSLLCAIYIHVVCLYLQGGLYNVYICK